MALLKPKWLYNSNEFKDSVNHRVHVHTINIGNIEDPEFNLAEHLYNWQQTEKGKWVMKNSQPSPSYHEVVDHVRYEYVYYICAYFNEKDLVYWKLKFT